MNVENKSKNQPAARQVSKTPGARATHRTLKVSNVQPPARPASNAPGAPVGRAEFKLAGAVEAFRYDFRGKTVLDIGSSTGGFTEYALIRGAAKVFAIEKGTNQMKAPLRFDSRIDLREKTDIFTVTSDTLLKEDEKLDVILADVSFVSLKKVLLYAKLRLASRQTDFLVMLKPQFEAKREQLVKGVVKNEKIRREIIKDFELWLAQNGFIVKNKRDNSLSGKTGNLERFYWLNLAKSHKNHKKY